jgi:serine O-acetyltransferase
VAADDLEGRASEGRATRQRVSARISWQTAIADIRFGVRRRAGETSGRYALRAAAMLCVTPRLRAMPLFRLAHYLDGVGRVAIARYVQGRIQRSCGADIHPSAAIGAGCWLSHSSGVVIGHLATVGERCEFHQGVTIGSRGSPPWGHPTLGNDIVIGAGAVIVGPIRVGDGARIGANSVVTSDVPAGATAVGAPARILPAGPTTS